MAVSFGLSWGVYNAGVSIGYVSKNAAIGGILLTASTTTDYYIAKIEKKTERHLVDVYQYGQYQYSYYTTVSSVRSQRAYLEKV